MICFFGSVVLNASCNPLSILFSIARCTCLGFVRVYGRVVREWMWAVCYTMFMRKSTVICVVVLAAALVGLLVVVFMPHDRQKSAGSVPESREAFDEFHETLGEIGRLAGDVAGAENPDEEAMLLEQLGVLLETEGENINTLLQDVREANSRSAAIETAFEKVAKAHTFTSLGETELLSKVYRFLRDNDVYQQHLGALDVSVRIQPPSDSESVSFEWVDYVLVDDQVPDVYPSDKKIVHLLAQELFADGDGMYAHYQECVSVLVETMRQESSFPSDYYFYNDAYYDSVDSGEWASCYVRRSAPDEPLVVTAAFSKKVGVAELLDVFQGGVDDSVLGAKKLLALVYGFLKAYAENAQGHRELYSLTLSMTIQPSNPLQTIRYEWYNHDNFRSLSVIKTLADIIFVDAGGMYTHYGQCLRDLPRGDGVTPDAIARRRSKEYRYSGSVVAGEHVGCFIDYPRHEPSLTTVYFQKDIPTADL